jgi:hypothetical protein
VGIAIVAACIAGCGARTGLALDDAAAGDADGGVRADAGRSRDAGMRRPDSGTRRRDAGVRGDAGLRRDGGLDAGAEDAGVDAGEDAGLLDAGPPIPPDRDPTGVWITEVTPPAAPTVIALHRRARGELMAYVMGASQGSQITSGHADLDGNIRLETNLRDPMRESIQMRTGIVEGDRIRMDPAPEGGPSPDLLRLREPASERRYVIYQGSAAAPIHRYDFSASFDVAGVIYSGSLVARDDCTPMCSGRVLAWTETADGTVIDARSSPCTTYTITITGSRATWDLMDCMGGRFMGEYLAARAPGANSDGVQGILATLGAIADDLENGRRFGVPYERVSTEYRHHGLVAHELLDRWNDERELHAPVDVEFTHIRQIATEPTVGDALRPGIWLTQTVRFRDRRTSASGMVYRDVDTQFPPMDDKLAFLRQEDGVWRMFGVDRF